MSFARTPLSFAIFSVLSTSVLAESTIETSDKTEKTAITLNTISLKAEKDNNEVGKTVYTKEDIERTPNSSKNITDFLKVNPNVQFGNNAQSALQQGELKPAEISINGGLPYDNKFLINGMSVNNNINPVGATEANSPTDLLGSSQTVSVNTDLLCNITLLDSNVSAEYGEFTGGVVSAETCKPKTEIGKLHGSITYDYTTDTWSKVNFSNESDEIAFENSAKENNQPYFTKQGVSASVYGNITESLGFNVYGSYRHSAIPLKTNIADNPKFDQKRKSTNGGFELFYTPTERTDIKIGAQFFEDQGLYFSQKVKNSESLHSSDSQSFYINLKTKLDSMSLNQQLNYQTQNAQRETADHFYAFTPYNEGQFGDLNQQESRLEYLIKSDFNTIETRFLNHRFTVGAGYGHYEASSTRAQDTFSYTNSTDIPPAKCMVNGILLEPCNSTTNIAFNRRMAYYASDLTVSQDRWHAFIQDTMSDDKYFSSTLGIRFDYDSLTKNNNVAPRTHFTFKPFGNSALQFTTGWNRYYGLNAFANELSDRLDQYQVRENRKMDSNNDYINDWTKDPKYKGGSVKYRSELKTPYSDETVFAIQSNFQNTNLMLKWVNRDNKNQIRSTPLISDSSITGNATQLTKTFDNSGRSTSDIYTFSVQNIEPLNFKSSIHFLNFAADYTKTGRNFETYQDLAYNGTPEVIYDGKKIDAQFIPSSNFNTPWTVRGTWNIGFTNFPLKVSNFFTYKAPRESMKKTKKVKFEDGIYDVYSPYQTNASFTWDMRTTFDINLGKNLTSILGLTINNVTNRNNTYVIETSGVAKPEIGRQFIADITFKF